MTLGLGVDEGVTTTDITATRRSHSDWEVPDLTNIRPESS